MAILSGEALWEMEAPEKMSTAYIHIGLPKTATTFLQNRIFPSIKGVSYFNRSSIHDLFVDQIGEGLRSSVLKSPVVWNHAPGRALRKILAHTDNRDILISEENLSANARFFDFKSRLQQDPIIIANHLANMRTAIQKDGRFDRVKVLTTIRRQDTWIASRYAQSGSKVEDPSQSSFEKAAKILINSKHELYRSAMIINYRYLDDSLRSIFDKSDLCFLPMESIQSSPDFFYGRLVDFFDGNDSFMKAAEREKSVVSSNAEGENRWKLRLDDEQQEPVHIEMTDQLRDKIMAKFARTNALLSKRYGLDLDRYGYF